MKWFQCIDGLYGLAISLPAEEPERHAIAGEVQKRESMLLDRAELHLHVEVRRRTGPDATR